MQALNESPNLWQCAACLRLLLISGACGAQEWGDGEMLIIGGRPKKDGENVPPYEFTSIHAGSEFEVLQ